MVFSIKVNNSYVDFTPYIARQGVKWQRSDIEGEDAGRTLDGTMVRSRITTKIRLDVTCRPLTATEAHTVLSAIQPEFVTVKYDDILTGTQREVVMYSNNVPASYLMRKGTTDYWSGITFPLIEQ